MPRSHHAKVASRNAGETTVRIVHISDTHSRDYDSIPAGDILVHSGDFTNQGHPDEVAQFNAYLKRVPHKHKVVICGNHELGFDRMTLAQRWKAVGDGVDGFVMLDQSSAVVMGIKFYGCSANNCGRMAFGASVEDRAVQWERIPADTDVLITHNPPLAIMDNAWVRRTGQTACALCNGETHPNFEHWGCPPLRKAVERLAIPLHCFGHVHDANGIEVHGATHYSNASMDIARKPCVIDMLVDDAARMDVPAAAAPPVAAEHATTTQQAAATTPLHACTLAVGDDALWRQNRAPVLDADSQDPNRKTVMLWKELANAPKNQQWVIAPAPGGAAGHVVISSMWSQSGDPRAPDRFLAANLDGDGAIRLSSKPFVWVLVQPVGDIRVSQPYQAYSIRAGRDGPLLAANVQRSGLVLQPPNDRTHPATWIVEHHSTQ